MTRGQSLQIDMKSSNFCLNLVADDRESHLWPRQASAGVGHDRQRVSQLDYFGPCTCIPRVSTTTMQMLTASSEVNVSWKAALRAWPRRFIIWDLITIPLEMFNVPEWLDFKLKCGHKPGQR